MDVDKVRKLLDELAAFMSKHNLTELTVESDGTQIKLRKPDAQSSPQVIAPSAVAGPLGAARAAAQPAHPASAAAQTAPAAQEPGTAVVTSPMVGTFYRASKPESDPFVEVADEVNEDTVLCIIEAMKVMNEIKAEHKGRVVKILVENGEPVEYGQPLFHIAL